MTYKQTPDNIAYLYDGSVEGLFTAVFLTYAYKEDPIDICPEAKHQPRLGQAVRIIETDFALATRVQRGICRVAGYEVFDIVKVAALSDEPHTGMAVYRFIRYCMDARNAYGFSHNRRGEDALRTSRHQHLGRARCAPS